LAVLKCQFVLRVAEMRSSKSHGAQRLRVRSDEDSKSKRVVSLRSIDLTIRQKNHVEQQFQIKSTL